MTSSPEIDAAGKKLISQAMENLATAIQQAKEALSDATKILERAQAALNKAEMKDTSKLKNIISVTQAVVNNAPMDTATMKDTLKVLGKYAGSRNISIPRSATDIIY